MLNLLLTRKLYLGVTITLLVDVDVLFAAWTVILVGDIDLLLGESSIFPSDARGVVG